MEASTSWDPIIKTLGAVAIGRVGKKLGILTQRTWGENFEGLDWIELLCGASTIF